MFNLSVLWSGVGLATCEFAEFAAGRWDRSGYPHPSFACFQHNTQHPSSLIISLSFKTNLTYSFHAKHCRSSRAISSFDSVRSRNDVEFSFAIGNFNFDPTLVDYIETFRRVIAGYLAGTPRQLVEMPCPSHPTSSSLASGRILFAGRVQRVSHRC